MNDSLLNGGLEGAIALHQLLQLAVATVFLLWASVLAVHAYRQPPGWGEWITWSIALSLAALVCSPTWLRQVAPGIGISEHAIQVAQAAAFGVLVLSIVAGTLLRVINVERRHSE